MADIKPSSEMPIPETIDYGEMFQITPLFISDLKKVLADSPWIDAQRFFKKIEEYNCVMPNAILNEFIRDIANMPYKVVAGLMSVINKPEYFVKYFTPIPQNDKQNQQATEQPVQQ